MLEIFREVHRRHATRAKFSLDAVPALEGRAKAVWRRSHARQCAVGRPRPRVVSSQNSIKAETVAFVTRRALVTVSVRSRVKTPSWAKDDVPRRSYPKRPSAACILRSARRCGGTGRPLGPRCGQSAV